MPQDPMLTEGAVAAYLEKLDSERRSVEHSILSGGCRTFEEYRHMLGRLAGLTTARARYVEMLDEQMRRRLGEP